ncbi:hypothetical protein VTL71DRAFT_5247 [Oculimacula yallundae]|uniref:Uncharacterized protein n=1 Tax=Oculimacula yallundae TaxID=86028 RepID=A0ABR4C0M6_9HELO
MPGRAVTTKEQRVSWELHYPISLLPPRRKQTARAKTTTALDPVVYTLNGKRTAVNLYHLFIAQNPWIPLLFLSRQGETSFRLRPSFTITSPAGSVFPLGVVHSFDRAGGNTYCNIENRIYRHRHSFTGRLKISRTATYDSSVAGRHLI